MAGHLCLRWNNHTTAFNKLLNKIYLQDVYSDGTILCQGKFYPVHCFVLSTCSDYFEEMFRQCIRLNNKHPFIIVKDIHPDQMEALLNYMYKGEVNVPQEMLPDLIKAAEVFKIKGLAVPDEEPTPKHSRKRSSNSSPASISKKSRRHEEKYSCSNKTDAGDSKSSGHLNSSDIASTTTQSYTSSQKSNDEVDTFAKIKEEPVEAQDVISIIDDYEVEDSSIKVKQEQEYESFKGDETNFEAFDFDASNDNFDDTGTYDEGQESASWDNSQPFEGEVGTEDDSTQRLPISDWCSSDSTTLIKPKRPRESAPKNCPFPSCSYTTTHTGHMGYHIRKHTGEKPFACPKCTYRSTQKSNITVHMLTKHSDIEPFLCPHCTNKFYVQSELKQHIVNRHQLPLL